MLRWVCARGCGDAGEKHYDTPARATRYARAFDREDREDFGRRPLLSMLPLKLVERMRGGE